MTTTTLPHLHLLEEVAEKYDLSVISLRRRARAKGFTHIKIGKKRYLTDEQVVGLLKTCTVSATTEAKESQRAAELAAAGKRVTQARGRRKAAA